MIRNQITPLRTNVGRALEIQSVNISFKSSKAANGNYTAVKLNTLSESENVDYRQFLPAALKFENNNLQTAPGYEKYVAPIENNFPFSNSSNGVSINGLIPSSASIDPRELFVDIEITLNRKENIGGICFTGFPFLSNYINKHGENSSNFGLPREVRVSWDEGVEFIDNENAYTRQETISHSGVQYMNFGPVKFDKIIIRFSDWPKFIIANNATSLTQKFGFVIPLLVVYEKNESVVYRSHLPMGLLACTKYPVLKAKGYFRNDYFSGETINISGEEGENNNADYSYQLSSPSPASFFTLSAASAFGQKRKFTLPGTSPYEEYFLSVPFKTNESINFHIEQSSETERCVAGCKITFQTQPLVGNLRLPALRIKIYELDLIEGISPLDISPTEINAKKYLSEVFEQTFINPGVPITCKFKRASLSRYFLISFENMNGLVNEKRGNQSIAQLAIKQFEFIQSAHVSITTKSAHNITIENINLRLIGENLSEDYSKIGQEGFTLAIETLSAGNKKKNILAVNNLLELLNLGSTRLYSNIRRLEPKTDVSTEESETLGGSYDIHSATTNNQNWRKTESDPENKWRDEFDAFSKLQNHFPEIVNFMDKNLGAFENLSASEIRTYNELIGGEGPEGIAGKLKAEFVSKFGNAPFENASGKNAILLRKDFNGYDWRHNIWQKAFNLRNENFFIDTVQQLNIPPWMAFLANLPEGFLDTISGISSNVKSFFNMINGNTGPVLPILPNLDEMNKLINVLIPPITLINGLSIGVSGSVQCLGGISFSASTAQLIPNLVTSSTTGSSGNISKQATKTGYSYSQLLSTGQDLSKSFTVYDEGLSNRKITRYLNQSGSVKERNKGGEIMWQNRYQDILTSKIPLGITLPATGGKFADNIDQSIRIKLSGVNTSAIEVDIWFDIIEEQIKEDY